MFFLKKKICLFCFCLLFFDGKSVMPMFCNAMLLLLYVHVCVPRTGWKTRPRPKTVILLIKQSINQSINQSISLSLPPSLPPCPAVSPSSLPPTLFPSPSLQNDVPAKTRLLCVQLFGNKCTLFKHAQRQNERKKSKCITLVLSTAKHVYQQSLRITISSVFSTVWRYVHVEGGEDMVRILVHNVGPRVWEIQDSLPAFSGRVIRVI